MHNEQGNVRALYDDIKGVMVTLEQSYEIIFVNDASSDQTLAKMREIQECDSDFHFADLATNVGENWALLAGISKAQGEVITKMIPHISLIFSRSCPKAIALYPDGDKSGLLLSGPNVSLHKLPTR